MSTFILKAFAILFIITLTIGNFNLADAFAIEPDTLSDAEIAIDNVFAPTNSDLVEFTFDIRWGYVRGNVLLDKAEKIYNGSVMTDASSSARINLIKTRLFESTDIITSTKNPVAWVSKIYGHWDGLSTAVIAKAETEITIQSGDFKITKPAKDWFALTAPALVKNTTGQMLVVKVNKKNHRRQGILIWWGKKDQGTFNCITTPCPGGDPVDFSGSLTMSEDAFVKLKKPLRFESNDSITEHNRQKITWTSSITTDRDGLLTLMLPTRTADTTAGFTLTFNTIKNGESAWSKNYSLENIQAGTRDIIKINGVDYIVAVGNKYLTRQLVKAKISRRLYLIVDNIKYEVTNNDVLKDQGYSEIEAVIMDDDEVESYKDGGNLNYPDGTIAQDISGTYIIENNLRRLLANENVIRAFTATKQLFIKRASQLRLGEFELGRDVSNPTEILDGSLVKVQGETAVWQIVGDKRKIFTHVNIFNLHRLDFNKVRTISQTELQQFDWAPPVKYPDGALVKIPTDPKVYLLRAGVRHWVETEDDLRGLGFSFSDIKDMSPADITNYPEGEPVVTN